MAQHLPIDEDWEGETAAETKAIRSIVHGVQHDNKIYGGLKASVKWSQLPAEYTFDGSDAAFNRIIPVRVPGTMVWGGKANIEAHTKGGKLFRIYLVA